MDLELKIADAVIAVLEKNKDADLGAWLGWVFQEPLDETAIRIKREIGQAALVAARL